MRIPAATYRIQFNKDFGFKSAVKRLTYLNELGISGIYASPIFKAREDSSHGYDIVDPHELNPEPGSYDDAEALMADVKHRHMVWLQDIVPNHMAFDHENALLMDVLENGRHSRYRAFFDIDWDHAGGGMQGRLLAPFLGEPYVDALESGKIRLCYDKSGFRIHYADWIFPLRIESWAMPLSVRLEDIQEKAHKGQSAFIKLSVVLHLLRTLPSKTDLKWRDILTGFISSRLWQLYVCNRSIRQYIDGAVALYNEEKKSPGHFDKLDALLDEQVFRLSYWKVAGEDINYRRFFYINDLISLRMEDPQVFDHYHALIFRLVREGWIDGLRIDHIDGLADPAAYLTRLQKNIDDRYVVVEKILEPGETLPSSWPAAGTTGYDFMNVVNGLFCRSDNEARFNAIYAAFYEAPASIDDLLLNHKKIVIKDHMGGDVDNLTHCLVRAANRDCSGRDLTFHGLRAALVETSAAFPVYRTYIDTAGAKPSDRAYVEHAIRRAKGASPGLQREIDCIGGCLLAEPASSCATEEADRRHFVAGFQQFTAPLMAKGFEDMFLYVYNRLISLNEVGGDPRVFGISANDFHQFNRQRQAQWPHSLNATTTHDTKRSEDVRARINVLSELPDEWQRQLAAWRELNAGKKENDGKRIIPDGNDEYYLYQTLIGTCNFDEKVLDSYTSRIKAHAVKAVREAGVHSDWSAPDEAYENGYTAFIERILESSPENGFLKQFVPFCRKVAHYGMLNSLAQTLIKMTAPGVPDFYQGSELWDLNLADPDNRRPVDFDKRAHFLKDIISSTASDISRTINALLPAPEDGRLKLFLIYRALQNRNRHQAVFAEGHYIPLTVEGALADHLIAFARVHQNRWCLTAVPRWMTSLVKEGSFPLGDRIWGDTVVQLPDGAPAAWHNAFTLASFNINDGLPVADMLRHFPVALLTGEKKK